MWVSAVSGLMIGAGTLPTCNGPLTPTELSPGRCGYCMRRRVGWRTERGSKGADLPIVRGDPKDRSWRLLRELERKGDEQRGPRTAGSQRQGMCHHLISGRYVVDTPNQEQAPCPRFHAKRHRRVASDVPGTSANQLVPVPHACGPHLDQHLASAQGPGFRKLAELDRVADVANPRYPHPEPAPRDKSRPT
jgi:hypothetical protein